jgi:NAD(P)-dependent dehydrogenase (short-subunit alcohol dehydrogenase family)
MGAKVLITGGSGGIGAAVAEACAARGAWPIVGYRDRRQAAIDAVAQCGAGEILALDLAREDLGLSGPLPAASKIVHCAGWHSPERSLLAASTEDLQSLFAIHVFGPLRLMRAALAAGAPLDQVLFVLSSAAGCRGSGPYALSKAAALAACKLLAAELAPRGVRLTALVLGWAETPMAEAAARGIGRDMDEIRAQHLDGRILCPEEVGRQCADWLFDAPGQSPAELIVWDRRDAREPFRLDFESVFSLDRRMDFESVESDGLGCAVRQL